MTKRQLLNVPLAGSSQPKACNDEVSTPNAAKKAPITAATAGPKHKSLSAKSDSQDTILISAATPAQPAKRRKLLLLSKHAEPQPAASTTAPSKPARQELKKTAQSTSSSNSPGSPPKSIKQSAAVQQVSQNEVRNTSAAGSQPTTAWTTSLLQPARAPAQHAAQSGVRNKSGSPSSTAAAATVTPSGKTTQPPEQRRVTPTSTPKSESSAAPAIQADSYSHCTEVGLGSECNSSATSTPVRLAGSPAKGPASGHGSVALLPQSTSAQKVPMQQEQTRKPRGHSASALLPAPKAHLPATCTANAVPDRKVGAHIPPVQPSMQEGIKQDKDTLLMVRRLPAVLTGTLPTLESLGVQLHLPSGATLLKQLPKKPRGPYAGHVQHLCHPGMVKDVQSRLVPQADHSEMAVIGNQVMEDAAAFVLQGMHDSRLQKVFCSLMKYGLTLTMPAIVADNKDSLAADLSSFEPVCDEDDGHKIGLDVAAADGGGKQASACPVQDDTTAVSEAEANVQSLILKQQIEFAHIWSSPETQAEECMAYDAFPVVLSFLQAVLN